MLSQRIIEMPKIDLHCHLDGSIPKKCIDHLYGRNVDIRELQVEENCQSLAEYLEKFAIPVSCIQSAEGLKLAAREFLLSLAEDNVKYVEVRFAPLLSVNAQLNVRNILEAVIEGLEEAKIQTGIYYNVIACAMRHHALEDSMNMLKICREYLGSGLCAVDLAGDEAAFPMELFSELFSEAKKLGLPFTIHAGECGRVKNVELAVECGARRIGHGIALRGCQREIQLCKDKRIGIEMCPISNLQTKAVAQISEYPIREFLNNDLLVTLNTDNRVVSNTNITKEMEFVQMYCSVTEDELKQITRNAIETAFASDAVKHELLKMI